MVWGCSSLISTTTAANPPKSKNKNKISCFNAYRIYFTIITSFFLSPSSSSSPISRSQSVSQRWNELNWLKEKSHWKRFRWFYLVLLLLSFCMCARVVIHTLLSSSWWWCNRTHTPNNVYILIRNRNTPLRSTMKSKSDFISFHFIWKTVNHSPCLLPPPYKVHTNRGVIKRAKEQENAKTCRINKNYCRCDKKALARFDRVLLFSSSTLPQRSRLSRMRRVYVYVYLCLYSIHPNELRF